MSKEERKSLFVIITITLFVIAFIVLWRVYIVPMMEEVMEEVMSDPDYMRNPRVQEALSEPAVLAGLYALDGQTGQVQWTAQLKGISFGDPAVAGDRVFMNIHTSNSAGPADTVLSTSDTVAIDTKTGREVWHIANGESHVLRLVVRYPPIATSDIMIDDTLGPQLDVYEADTGELLYQIEDVVNWSRNPDDVLPVALTEDRLIVRREPTNGREITDAVQAYDLHSGDLLWSTNYEPYPEEQDNDAVHLSPILADNQRVFLEVVDQFQAFDIDSGDFLFALDQTCTQAKIQGSILYCVNGDLKAFDAATGELQWSFYPDDLALYLQEVEAVEDTIYVTTTQAKRRQFLIAVNPADGSERWRVRVWDSALSADEETVFAIQVIKRQKALVALSATDGTQLWQFPLYSDDRHIPVSDGEKVYIVDIANR